MPYLIVSRRIVTQSDILFNFFDTDFFLFFMHLGIFVLILLFWYLLSQICSPSQVEFWSERESDRGRESERTSSIRK